MASFRYSLALHALRYGGAESQWLVLVRSVGGEEDVARLAYDLLPIELVTDGAILLGRTGGSHGRVSTCVLAQLAAWLDDYNRLAPHSALGMRSPADYRAVTSARCELTPPSV